MVARAPQRRGRRTRLVGLLGPFSDQTAWATDRAKMTASSAGARPELYELVGSQLSLAWGIPFVGMLLSIALLPLLAPRFWEHNFGKIAAFWSAAFLVPMCDRNRSSHGGIGDYPHAGCRIRPLPYSVVRVVRNRRWNPPGGNSRCVAGDEYCDARIWHDGRQSGRHHGCFDVDDSADDPGQSKSAASYPRFCVFYFPGLKYRWIFDSARRSATLSRLPQRS